MNFLSVNEEVEVTIKKYGINGEGIGYINRLAIFVPNALIDETVKVRITKIEDKYSEAEIVSYINKSKDRVEPFCPNYGLCGGCQLQHLGYNKTLELKRDLIIESISKYTTLNPKSFEIKKTIGMDNPKGYRNKSALPVRFDGKKSVVGIYKANSNRLIPLTTCPIQNDKINEINNMVLKYMDELNVLPYDSKKNIGSIRYIVTRIGLNTNEVQITLVLGNKCLKLEELVKKISTIPNVKSVYTDYNHDPKSPLIFNNKIRKQFGNDTITEKLGNFKFVLKPNAFFQLNPIMTEKLYDEVKKASKLSMKEKVLDAYCGVGTIGIWVSKLAKEVIGIEANKEAIENALDNVSANKIKNVKFINGEVMNELPKLVENGWEPDVILLDPPRTGLGVDLCNLLLKTEPKRIVYVSCNPSTMAKDINYLSTRYNVNYIQPLDMFPYTARVECIVQLNKR